jgi:hypothetical protein
MKPATYVRIIRLGSMVAEGGPKPRLKWKQLEPLRVGDWIEGKLIKAIRVGDDFRLRALFHNGQLCRRSYLSSPVVAIQQDQVLTYEVRYKVLRVPKFDPKRSLKSWD